METNTKINAILILEILGKPPGYLYETLNGLVGKLSNEKDVTLINKKLYDPKPTENLFVAFAELEIQVPSLMRLIEICFAYMPSSVEIVEPADLNINLNDANAIINNLMARLHQYDAIAKRITFENNILKNQMQQINNGLKEQKKIPQNVQENKKNDKSRRKINVKLKSRKPLSLPRLKR
ncbi:MAG: hypothetical protein V1660_03445 [archaeon]